MATVLVVDDSPTSRQLVVMVLGYSGHQPLEASDGPEALDLVRTQRPDMAIVDLLMPTMDGYQFVQRLRADPTYAYLPVVFYTATYREDEARSLAQACGVSRILMKPADPELIVQTVDEVLGSSAAPDPTLSAEEFRNKHESWLTDRMYQKVGELAAVNARLTGLLDLSQHLATQRDSILMLRGFSRTARELVGAKYAALIVLNEDGRTARHYFSSGLSAAEYLPNASVALDRGVIARLLEDRRPQRLRALDGRCDVLGLPAGHPPLQSFMGAPIRSPTQLHGLIYFGDKVGADEFSADDERVAVTVATQLAVVYENLQRYEQSQRNARQLEKEIAERKQAEEAMRQSDAHSRAIVEAALDCIITIDQDGMITEFNPAAVKTFGYSREAAIGRELAELIIPPALRDSHRRGLELYRATGQGPVLGKRVELTGMRADGSEFPVELAITPFSLEGRTLFTGSLRDVTDRKRAESRIREQAALLDKANDAILASDLGDRIVFWNPTATRLYGWSSAEAIGTRADELLFKGPNPELQEAQQSVWSKGEWTGELHQVTKDGKDIRVQSRWTLVRDDDGKPQSKLVVNTDVTEKRKLEAQFLRAQRMDSIGTLAGGIAHDLNNVLTPITMAIELLKMQLADDRRQAILAELGTSAARGAEMVKQILLFARGADGQRVSLQLKPVLDEIHKMSRRTFPKSIEIKVAIPEDLAIVSGDATHLYQMLMNLCVNARDAMPGGGCLTITAENVVLDAGYAQMQPGAQAGPYVLIKVTDTGMGIPADILSKIFDPFFTTKEPGKGTGLGLSTVLGLVKAHGGFVTVQSEVGRGSEFSVYLPALVSAHATIPEREASELPGGNGELILVVDDEAAICQIARETLEAYRYKVLTAADGTDAVALYVQHRGTIRVVLTDMMMPTMDGPTTIRALRKIDPNVCVIAASGRRAMDKTIESTLVGVRAFLPKPYTADRLLTTLHKVLAGRGAHDEQDSQRR